MPGDKIIEDKIMWKKRGPVEPLRARFGARTESGLPNPCFRKKGIILSSIILSAPKRNDFVFNNCVFAGFVVQSLRVPVEISTEIRIFNQEQFHAIDRRVMGVVFEVHSQFGRLLEEELFKREIAARCAALGLQPIEREVRIQVTHEDFAKD